MLNFLKGKKTYIVAALMFLVQSLQMAGKITPDLASELLKLLAVGGVASVAAKINRMGQL
jgi:hypothetical protein